MSAQFQGFHLGTYTSSGGSGIGSGTIDPDTGAPVVHGWIDDLADPSWLEASPDQETLYAVSELSPDGLIAALSRTEDGRLTVRQVEPTGAKPAHICVHPNGRFLFTSLYDGGGVGCHPITTDGSVQALRDVRPHRMDGVRGRAHQVVIDPTGVYFLAVDLGLDTVFCYKVGERVGRLMEMSQTTFKVGSGPRHLAFHPAGEFAYVAGELDSTVTTCRWSDGMLSILESSSTLLSGESTYSNYPGEIAVSKDGRFVYVTNRGSNTVAVFAVHDDGERLELLATPASGGDWPRHLAIDDSGRWLYVANERSGELAWFPLDPETGLPGELAGTLPVPGVTQILLTRP